MSKKRILIVNCYFDDSHFITARKTKIPQSITPAYLAGVFSKQNCDVRLFSELYSGHLENPGICAWPDMLVLTGLNSAFDRFLHITAYVKSKNPKAVVVAGGSIIKVLKRYARPFFDYCCYGGIEELAGVVEDVYGTAYVCPEFKEKGWVVPRYDLAYWMKLMSYVESSRNCYHRCSFCSLTAEERRFRPYDITYLERQFEALGKRNLLFFMDNNFNCLHGPYLRQRFDLLDDLYRRGKFNAWGAEVSSDFFSSDEYLTRAKQSGCICFYCGLESFDVETLSNFKKKGNVQLSQFEVIKKCLDAGIFFSYGLMLDVVNRSVEQLKQELDLIFDHPQITLPAFLTLPIPLVGTPYFNECVSKNRFMKNVRLRDLDGMTLNLKPLDPLDRVVRFFADVKKLKGYRYKALKHQVGFYKHYRKKLAFLPMSFSINNLLLLMDAQMTTAPTEAMAILKHRMFGAKREYIGPKGPLDPAYRPKFNIDSKFKNYFNPTMITDHEARLMPSLYPDLMEN